MALKKEALLDAAGNDERGYLKDLYHAVYEGKNPSSRILDIYNEDEISFKKRIYEEFSY